ncbi:ABC-2 type transport system permease protein [Parasphingorhabdus marina DSM 22363]|uniref:ABC-2 type transport system permease protein n=1 Tax=Parasphingorhabdus marina DSM 22363 TaxID=1123272 RepID=A0A1N6CQM3_9SPHN|nr:ABC transporter permease [Parasphingorhabdus marina]SIN60817.1 ABC-2 type transport system permease protein [Parasphingorhabdus marina DSM 22363]
MSGRIGPLIIKEALAVLRDRRARLMLIAPPIIQLLLFSFASTLDVNHARIVVLNQDQGAASTEIIRQIQGSKNVADVTQVQAEYQIEQAIRAQDALAGIKFSEDFSSRVAAGETAEIRVVLDGRKSNAAQIFNGYLVRIAQNAAITLTVENRGGSETAREDVAIIHAYNPNLEEFWHVLPSLLGILACMTTLSISAQSVARERELGTFEQLLVTPLKLHEILIGKAVPAIFVGLANATLFVVATIWLFDVPLQGSIFTLYFALTFFVLAVVGVGLLISSLSTTQQQAFLGTFIFLTPAVLLSGYASPIDNTPFWMERLSMANPVRHMTTIAHGVFLKDTSFQQILASVFPLMVIAAISLTSAAWLFRRRME